MKPFSKLKKQIESLFDPSINMDFCCYAFPMKSTTGYAHNSIPRFCVKLNKEVIWDYPKDFPVKDLDYGYWAGNNGISELVRLLSFFCCSLNSPKLIFHVFGYLYVNFLIMLVIDNTQIR